MTSLLQGIERRREQGTDLPSGTVSVRDLMRRFPPTTPGSTSSLITTMLAGARTPFNWAVILCRFSDTPSDPAIESLFRRAFAPGSGGLVEYWSDVSLGKIDISGSKIFGWVTLDITRAQASVGSGMRRTSLTAKAVEAAKRAGLDVETGFNSQMAVLTHNWTRDDLTPEQMTGDDRYTWWIDGSSDGSIVCAHPLLHQGDLLAHEMGHVHQFDHDYAADLTTAYGDPFCLMSAANNTGSFVQPDTNLNYGPAICLPHLTQFGWHYPRRILQNPESWQTSPVGVTFTLATVDDLAARGTNLGAVLPLSAPLGWSYQLEYARRVGWNRGLRGDELLIRRWFNSSVGPTTALLATVAVPDTVSGTASVTEPRGNTEFTVQRIDAPGRTIQVTARKL